MYNYMDLLDRIEKTISEKKKNDDEEEKEEKGENPIAKPISSTKTSWHNFYAISQQIQREPQHILDFVKAELDVEGNFGS